MIKTIGTNKVAVPTHFYKIILDPVRVEAIAFIMPNEELRTENMPNYIVNVDEVEVQTGLNFFSNIEDEVQNLVESRQATGLWE